MDKLLAIIRREYFTRVRSKGFIIGTILSPILMIVYILGSGMMFGKLEKSVYRITVLDRSGEKSLYDRAEKILTERNEKSDRFELQYEAITSDSRLESRKAELQAQMRERQIEGYLILPASPLQTGSLEFHTRNAADFSGINRLERAFDKAIQQRRLVSAGIDADKVEQLSKRTEIEAVDERGEKAGMEAFLIPFILLMLLYTTILVYGLFVMRGVVEEKQSRIIEVLLSSVRPFQLLLGKVIGIGLVPLTQLIVWVGSFLILTTVTAGTAVALGAVKLPRIPLALLAYFLIFFVLGYFLYATMYAVIGSIVSSEEDGQQAQLPITLTMVFQVMFFSMVISNPNGTLATVLSLIPFFTPLLMLARIAVEPPPFWQIALSIVLVLGTILGTIWVASKIYRVGVLMYGKRPTLPELFKWLKYT
jgi:ABC-2 type transport system permease protein